MNNKQKIQIRFMEEKDLEQVCKIENQLFSMPWQKKDFAAAIQNEIGIYLVAEQDDTILGYCGMWNVANEGQINNVAVQTDAQNCGIGYQMLMELIQCGKKEKITAFTLEVRVGNCGAKHLYEKLGFKEVGIRKKFYEKPVEDASIMWLYI